RTFSVEIPELIVDAIVESRIDRRRCRRLRVRMTRPLDRGEADRDQTSSCDEVRQEPRDAVEAFVDRRLEELLSAIDADQRLDDGVVILVLIDLRAELRAHVLRR